MKIKRLGILGGGQLGKMLCQSTSKMSIETTVLDAKPDYPAMNLCGKYLLGDFTSSEHVASMAAHCDIATIEIEKVSSEGLRMLEAQGVEVHPKPDSLDIIKDKGFQKHFYTENNLPTARYTLCDQADHILASAQKEGFDFPFVIKSRRGGYDGYGVQIIKEESDLLNCIDGPYLIEECVEIEKELALVVARNKIGQLSFLPMVEMVFDPEANLVDYLFAPALVDKGTVVKAKIIASNLVNQLDISGLLSIEFFQTKDGNLIINEIAPRPHNSGHFSIEACTLSQYDLHVRGVMNLPLVPVQMNCNVALMVNVLGGNIEGEAKCYGLDKILSLEGVSLHLYGKKQSRYKRKMGHITIVDENIESAIHKMNIIKENFRVEG